MEQINKEVNHHILYNLTEKTNTISLKDLIMYWVDP